jgi:hypothetical protein
MKTNRGWGGWLFKGMVFNAIFNIFQLYGAGQSCGSHQYCLDRGLLRTRKLLNQEFLLVKLKSSLRKFYGHHHDLVDRYGISVSQMTTNMFHLS